jgi:2-iminobutanoate/2-iminopropanoate deaminase
LKIAHINPDSLYKDIREGYAASQKFWGNLPTAITAAIVDSLAVPGALTEIEAIAVVDAGRLD